jgi:hypothetical protein
MQVAMYIDRETVAFVPCRSSRSWMRQRFPTARYACALTLDDEPSGEWRPVADAMQRNGFATMSLAHAIMLLGELTPGDAVTDADRRADAALTGAARRAADAERFDAAWRHTKGH